MIMDRGPSNSDPGPEPHARQPLGIRQEFVAEDGIDVGKVGGHQSNERSDDNRTDQTTATSCSALRRPECRNANPGLLSTRSPRPPVRTPQSTTAQAFPPR